jgi:NADPH:quinone reductase-like Zn-dependent oxidoreductase
VCTKHGSPDVLQFREVGKRTPKDDEVLIKVHATTASPADWHSRSGTPFVARIMAGRPLKPKIGILGFDVAGELWPVIDRSYPLSVVAEAHRYAEQGHVRGTVVITLAD